MNPRPRRSLRLALLALLAVLASLGSACSPATATTFTGVETPSGAPREPFPAGWARSGLGPPNGGSDVGVGPVITSAGLLVTAAVLFGDSSPSPVAGRRPPASYRVRLQAQGDGLERSVVLEDEKPITVAAGTTALTWLYTTQLTKKQRAQRAKAYLDCLAFIAKGPVNGGYTPNSFRGKQSHSCYESWPPRPVRDAYRIDLEVLSGRNFVA